MGVFDFRVSDELGADLDYSPPPSRRDKCWFAGIDVGKKGYVTVVDLTDKPLLVSADPMPLLGDGKGANYDLQELWRIIQVLQSPNIVQVILEQQQTHPKQGGSSNFTLGYAYGMLRAMLTAAGVSYEIVHPSRWKKAMGIKGQGDDPVVRKKDGKRRSLEKAQGLFPKVDFRPSSRHKPSVDMAEAALLAVYGGRHLVEAT
jgi:hypothetical protein